MDKEKKLDMIKTPYLSKLVTELNKIGVQREDLVGIFQPREGIDNNFVAIFYC